MMLELASLPTAVVTIHPDSVACGVTDVTTVTLHISAEKTELSTNGCK